MDINTLRSKLSDVYDDMYQTKNAGEVWALYHTRVIVGNEWIKFEARAEDLELANRRVCGIIKHLKRVFDVEFKLSGDMTIENDKLGFRVFIKGQLVPKKRVLQKVVVRATVQAILPRAKTRGKLKYGITTTLHVLNCNRKQDGYLHSLVIEPAQLSKCVDYVGKASGTGGYQFLFEQNDVIVMKRYTAKDYALEFMR